MGRNGPREDTTAMPGPLPPLPPPVSEVWDWRLRARCRNMDPNLFFPRDGEERGARARRERDAKAICAACPVLPSCRLHALTAREPFGVWGGTTEADRYQISRRRASSVPRYQNSSTAR